MCCGQSLTFQSCNNTRMLVSLWVTIDFVKCYFTRWCESMLSLLLCCPGPTRMEEYLLIKIISVLAQDEGNERRFPCDSFWQDSIPASKPSWCSRAAADFDTSCSWANEGSFSGDWREATETVSRMSDVSTLISHKSKHLFHLLLQSVLKYL